MVEGEGLRVYGLWFMVYGPWGGVRVVGGADIEGERARESSVSVYFVSPIWHAQALFRSKVDGCAPHTQNANF